MISESEGLPMKFWAKGNLFRGELTAGDRKIITIQRASETFVYQVGSKTGDYRFVERGLATMGLIRQIEDVRRFGKKQQSVHIEGKLYDVLLYDINAPEESALVYLSRKGSLPKVWISVLRKTQDSAEAMRMFFQDVEANVDIPEELFEIPKDVEFTSATGAVVPAVGQKQREPEAGNANVASSGTYPKSGLVVVTTADTNLSDGRTILETMQPGEIATEIESQGGTTLVKTQKHRGSVESHRIVPLEDADTYFHSALDVDPNNTNALLGRARLMVAFTENKIPNEIGRETLLMLALMDLNRLVRLTPSTISFLERGRVLSMMGKNEDALNDVNAALEQDQKNRDGFLRRIEISLKLGDHDRALTDCNELIRMDKQDAEAHSLRCFALGLKGEFDEALLSCDIAIDTDENFAKAYLIRGGIWESKNRDSDAELDYEKAIRLGENAARLARARFLLRQGKLNEAIADFSEMIKQEPDRWDAFLDRGSAWLDLNELDRAIEDVTTVLEHHPGNVDARIIRGLALSRKSEFDQAIDDFTMAILLNPDAVPFYAFRAQAYASKRQLDKAIEDYTHLLELSPNNLDATINRGLAYYFSKQHAKAIQDFSAAIELAPEDIQVYVFRGSARNGEGDFRGAIEDFSRVIKVKPNMSEAYSYRGVSWLALKEWERSIEDLNKALELDPSNHQAMVNRGGYWFGKNDFEKAIRDWELAWDLNPKSPELADQIARFYVDCPNEKYRDSESAIEFATIACELTQWSSFEYLETLATAYAESKDFDSAVNWMRKSLELAPQEKKPQREERLKSYQKGKRYVPVANDY
jgi:tetratricopeptide (TPR) repeat protein